MSPLRVWPSPSWPATVGAHRRPMPFPLDRPDVRLYAQARGALRDSLAAVGLRAGDEILVPSYHHGSEIEALLRASLRCRAYEPAADLQPVEEQLDALVSSSTRALHLIHHLGFPQDSVRWRTWCDRRGLLLIEDAAQAWLAVRDGLPVGTVGDLAVFCLYKTLALPDGAAVRARVELPEPARRGTTGLSYVVRPPARRLLDVVGFGRGARAYDQQADIAVPALSRGPSRLTRHLLSAADTALAADRRRAGYGVLLEGLAPLVPAPFDVLPAGASPFVFPIAVRDKGRALSVLESEGIHASDMWRLPHPAVRVLDHGPAAWLRRHLIGLPVHQGLDAAALTRIVRVAKTLEGARVPETTT